MIKKLLCFAAFSTCAASQFSIDGSTDASIKQRIQAIFDEQQRARSGLDTSKHPRLTDAYIKQRNQDIFEKQRIKQRIRGIQDTFEEQFMSFYDIGDDDDDDDDDNEDDDDSAIKGFVGDCFSEFLEVVKTDQVFGTLEVLNANQKLYLDIDLRRLEQLAKDFAKIVGIRFRKDLHKGVSTDLQMKSSISGSYAKHLIRFAADKMRPRESLHKIDSNQIKKFR